VTEPLRWAIVIAELEPSVGHEQRGRRRVVVVSYEPFHRSGMATVCPISSREPRYPGEVPIPRGEAGQTKDAVVLCHQVRTIDLGRVSSFKIGGVVQRVVDPSIRGQIRAALGHHLGLDVRPPLDAAT
jgi:mRNA interferase MazF